MSNGNIEVRLSALEVQMQEIRDLLNQTAQIASSNAKSIEANSQSISDLREAVRESFGDVLGLTQEIAVQQLQNTQDIGNLRAIVQDWITQDRQ